MSLAVKIRGIYTTALTQFFLRQGMVVANPSREILQRFKQHSNLKIQSPYDISIHDLSSHQGVLLKGPHEKTMAVLQLFRKHFLDVVFRFKEKSKENFQVEVEFPFISKATLDELRNQVIPTVKNHHRLRIIASEFVDLMEKMQLHYHPEKREAVSQELEQRLIWDNYEAGKELKIEHVKLDGEVIFLSSGFLEESNRKTKTIVLKRSNFKAGGIYDGLNKPIFEGDYAITRAQEGQWHYRHAYFRADGTLLGIYCNLNTPVEFYPDKIRYVDLEVDVIKWPDGRTQLVDQELLEKYVQNGVIGDRLKNIVLEKAKDLKSKID
ncbi:MAG: DUF402 domain-containing protein [Calditrichaeota bacterium]|nr:MAG: DUF402 domain-containing protein [Calditrichota bacterium]